MEYIPVEELIKHLNNTDISNLRSSNKEYNTKIDPISQKDKIRHLLFNVTFNQYKLLKLAEGKEDIDFCFDTIKILYEKKHIRDNLDIRELLELLTPISIKFAMNVVTYILWARDSILLNGEDLSLLFLWLFDDRIITDLEWKAAQVYIVDDFSPIDLRELYLRKASREEYINTINAHPYVYRDILQYLINVYLEE